MGSLRPLISLSRGCSQLDVAAAQSGRLTKGHSMLMSASNSCLGKLKTNCVLMGPAGCRFWSPLNYLWTGNYVAVFPEWIYDGLVG